MGLNQGQRQDLNTLYCLKLYPAHLVLASSLADSITGLFKGKIEIEIFIVACVMFKLLIPSEFTDRATFSMTQEFKGQSAGLHNLVEAKWSVTAGHANRNFSPVILFKITLEIAGLNMGFELPKLWSPVKVIGNIRCS